MPQATALEKLKEEQKKVKEALSQLESQKAEIQEKFLSVLKDEENLAKQLRECRDPYKYGQIEMRLNTISRSRREIESQKEELERKNRGFKDDLAKIEGRIEYLKPK